MLSAERELAAGDDDAGVRLGEAIGMWCELGGYELEGRWDSACRRIMRAGLDEIGDRPAATLSGGERKRLVLDLLFASDAQVLLLDEPDNFLDIPAKRRLEDQLRATNKTILYVSHDRELLARVADPAYGARIEQAMVFTVLAWDWNCSQHIPRLVPG